MPQPINAVEKPRLIFLVAENRSVATACNFLKNRGFSVHVFTDLKEFLQAVNSISPGFAFLSVDHPSKKTPQLPKVLLSSMQIEIVAIAEKGSNASTLLLQKMQTEYKTYPPFSGPSIERLILKVQKDRSRAELNSKEPATGDWLYKNSAEGEIGVSNSESSPRETDSGLHVFDMSSSKREKDGPQFINPGTGQSQRNEPQFFNPGSGQPHSNEPQFINPGTPRSKIDDPNYIDPSVTKATLNYFSQERPEPISGLDIEESEFEKAPLIISDSGSSKTHVYNDLNPPPQKSLVGYDDEPQKPIKDNKEQKEEEAASKGKTADTFTSSSLSDNDKSKSDKDKAKTIESPFLGLNFDGTTPNLSLELTPATPEKPIDPKFTNMARSTDRTLQALPDSGLTAEEVGSFETLQKVEKVKDGLCVIIDCKEFTGYLVCAFGTPRTIDSQLTQFIYDRLQEYLKESGQGSLKTQLVDVELKSVDFNNWSQRQAEFLKKSIYRSEEIALAFFPTDSIQYDIGKSAQEDLASIPMHELEGNSQLEFNLYLYLEKNGKYILYVPEKGTLLNEQRSRMILKGHTRAHVHKSALGDVKKYKAQRFLSAKINEFTKKIKEAG